MLVEDLCSIGQFGKREFEVNRKYEYMPNPNDETRTGVKMQLREDDHDKANKADQTEVESIMKSTQLHIVVATLIMTVTFAAGITLPGGFESDPDSPNKGMAILIRKTTFRAFVISDAIAFTFSASAIFIYFIMANASTLPQHNKLIQKLYHLASNFLCLSMFAVVIAFATGLLRQFRLCDKKCALKDAMKFPGYMLSEVPDIDKDLTFTAGFTLPGGFDSDTNSPNKGMFSMATNAVSSEKEFSLIVRLYMVATMLQLLSMTSVVIAFATGGFESGPDSHKYNQGMAILIRKTAFRAFVVSNAIAFTFSAVAIFIYFHMANCDMDIVSMRDKMVKLLAPV
ncbi:hypothetical protein BC332_14452 [Capsicum chinense]|nr:hypothetical protein BC332_14452 [Capsicum chinense]